MLTRRTWVMTSADMMLQEMPASTLSRGRRQVKKQPNTDIECLISMKIFIKAVVTSPNITSKSRPNLSFNQLRTQHDNDQTWVGQNDLDIFDVSCTYHFLPQRCNNLDEPLWGAARVAHHRFCLFCKTELFFSVSPTTQDQG